MNDAEIQDLIAQASKAALKAYAPYSGFKVGAALRTRDGLTFTGCNVENASYGLTTCAERAAISSAVVGSKSPLLIDSIVVVNADTRPCSPCGACRQVIAEFSDVKTTVTFVLSDGEHTVTVPDLVPYGFSLTT